jgi:hypothetical protein
MLDKGQKQTVGDNSTVVQGGGDVVVNLGLSYSDARIIAQDVAKATFFELAGQAKETMSARVEEITDRVLSKLATDYPAGLNKATDPDFQYSLLTVQKEYGKTGDDDLGGLLVDLLVERSKENDRNILQIVLNESLFTAPKLTKQHLSSLALIYLFKYTSNQLSTSHEQLGVFFDKHVQPFIDNVSHNDAAYQHLAFTGCGSASLVSVEMNEIFREGYPGLFQRGLSEDELQGVGFETYIRPPIFIRCLNDVSKYQIKALNHNVLDDLLKQCALSVKVKLKVQDLYRSNLMTVDEIKIKIISIRPYMADVYGWWSNSQASSFALTSVGIAIGHANITRHVGKFADLSAWIN